mmetsp:Transcript_68156/g.114572  ORF Transcript_68156/g.114572 Transcript_68156/m.114572 type:complete len:434 (+) Transcript_68156:34-1335(+)|eukprot:CAMPEP_0174383560 /NCGR_PEP_ID=MMETSP0811_2-20130205/125323_1 /TAXON_ID=73025 ORGANISM="Eutreptiella gymnastica-like, Strain CCMP1594" /NCGR_SAMPLE_ID=MMETSP0811_2 /ASSEMBLY_ACC=CAM_ASM_000667 /LENGTH=433 /DNA_ID=CAMNT_0015537199 /DNA_START=34 /DNA_END=1335 /DNA_ORIENTATION=-
MNELHGPIPYPPVDKSRPKKGRHARHAAPLGNLAAALMQSLPWKLEQANADATAERNLRPSTAPALRAPKQCSVPRYHRKGHLGMGHSDVLLPHSADSLVLKMEKQRLQEAKKAFRELRVAVLQRFEEITESVETAVLKNTWLEAEQQCKAGMERMAHQMDAEITRMCGVQLRYLEARKSLNRQHKKAQNTVGDQGYLQGQGSGVQVLKRLHLRMAHQEQEYKEWCALEAAYVDIRSGLGQLLKQHGQLLKVLQDHHEQTSSAENKANTDWTRLLSMEHHRRCQLEEELNVMTDQLALSRHYACQDKQRILDREMIIFRLEPQALRLPLLEAEVMAREEELQRQRQQIADNMKEIEQLRQQLRERNQSARSSPSRARSDSARRSCSRARSDSSQSSSGKARSGLAQDGPRHPHSDSAQSSTGRDPSYSDDDYD